jgi:hypothetical protein
MLLADHFVKASTKGGEPALGPDLDTHVCDTIVEDREIVMFTLAPIL